MPTYNPTTAGALAPGDKVRALATVGPSVAKAEYEDFPWTVERVQPLGQGRVRVWAHPHNARVSVESPIVYGEFAEADPVEVTP